MRKRDHGLDPPDPPQRPGDSAPPAAAAMGRVWPYALLVAVAIAFCGRAIFTGRSLAPLDMLLLMSPWKSYAARFPEFVRAQAPMLDPVQQYFPWRLFAVSSLKHGIVPLWNPYAFSGTPFLANLQSALFYPPNLLFLILPVALGFTYTAALHLALAGCFMFFFLRVWNIARWPAVGASAAYMLNGYFIAWLEYPAIGLWVAVWLPLLLALHELSVRRRSWVLTAGAGLVVGVQFLGGHLQVAAYVIFAYLLYAVARAIWPAGAEGEPAVRRVESLARAAASFALGLLLAAGQLAPTMELARQSFRPPLAPTVIRSTALPFTHLIIYFVPKFFGTPRDYNYWGNAVGRPAINFFETSGYVGVLPLLAACFGALEWRKPLAKYLIALTAISLLLALGTPLYLLFFYAVPGFKQLAGVARVMYLAAFALTALAAMGLDRLSRDRQARTQVAMIVFAITAIAFIAGVCAVFDAEIAQIAALGKSTPVPELAALPHYRATQIAIFVALLIVSMAVIAARRWVRPAAFGTACLGIIVADLFVAWVGFNPVNDPRLAYFETAATTYLQQHSRGGRMLAVGTSFLDWMPPNTPVAYGLRDLQGSDSLWWGRYSRFLNAVQPGAPTFDWRNLDSPALKMLAVRHIISTRPLADPAWEPVRDGDGLIYHRRVQVSRVRLFGNWQVMNDDQALAAIARGDAALLAAPALEADPGIAPQPRAAPGEAGIITDGIDVVRVWCHASAPRLLVVFDPDYPGWRAEVDGKAAPSHTADYVFRAVAVPAGHHVVTWRYCPASFHLGLFGGLAAVAGMAAIVATSVMLKLTMRGSEHSEAG